MIKIMKYLGQVRRCAGLFLSKEYEEIGIGTWQDSYLIAVCDTPGVSQEEIAARLYVHKSNVARHLGSLEEKGFIYREPDKNDRRVLRAYPTPKAATAAKRIRAAREEWNARVLSGFEREEAETLSRLLQKLADNAISAAQEREKER